MRRSPTLPDLDDRPADGDRSLQRRFARLTAINILANVTVPLASLVDTALLGHLADIRFLAGVALTSILFDYLYWTFGFLRMGTTGTTAQAMGRGDREEVDRTLYRSLTVAVGLGAGILILHAPLRELGFALLAGEPVVEAAGRAYFDARIWAAPAVLSNFVLLGWFLGREESGLALWMTVVGNLANVVANYVLIVHLGLAAFGAGLGTALSQYLMLGTGLVIFFSRTRHTRWRWREVLHGPSLRGLLRLNRDILIRTVALVTGFALFTNFSSVLGTVVLAANTVLLRYVSLAAYLIDGAAFATESLAGIFRGQGDGESLRRLRRLALGSGLAFSMPFVFAFLTLPGPLIRLLTTHSETVATALEYVPWLILNLLVGSFAYIWDGLYLGLTAGRPMRNAALLSTLVGFLPLALAALYLENNNLLWLSMVTFTATRAATLWWSERHLPLLGAVPPGDD